jgi:CBS domain-containing protein
LSSLVHLGRAAGHPAAWQVPRQREAVSGVLAPVERTVRPGAAADVMTRSPVTVDSGASMWTAWDLLRATGGRHLVVVDDHQRPTGVLDERMLALEWPAGPMGARRTPVHTLLRSLPRPRVRSAAELGEVARVMLGARVDAVPVVDRDGRLAGLVTLWHFAELAAARPTDEG